MFSKELKSQIQAQYDALLADCVANAYPEYFKKMTERFQSGGWGDWLAVIGRSRFDFHGKTVVDFGCKWGHTMLIFRGLGATQVIGVDAYSEYVETARNIFATRDDHIRVVESTDGFLEIPSQSVDYVFMCEVISHVNPQFLPVVWSEISRILKPGGTMLISDGNNLDLPKTQADVLEIYHKWECGPSGTTTSRDTVTRSFRSWRADLIREKFPALASDEVDHLALTTSGLFGAKFLEVVSDYMNKKKFTERRYEPGICPTNPTNGVVMERGFYPFQLVLELRPYLIRARQWKGYLTASTKPAWIQAIGWFVVDCCELLAQKLRRRLSDPQSNFTLIGEKVPDLNGSYIPTPESSQQESSNLR